MVKKGILITAGVIIVILIGGYAVMHKSPAKTLIQTVSSTSNSGKSRTTKAVDNSVVITKFNSNVGSYLASPNGQTLYTYSSDTKGTSSCTGTCLTLWPAYQDKGSTSGLPTNIGTIKRSDNGEIQYTYKGMPLYFFASETSGHVTGNGVAGFYVAKP